MSQPTEQDDGISFDADVALERVRDLYHLPVVAALLAFMLWNRQRYWYRFVADDGTVFFRGNDPYYHLRETTWTVHHFPWTMPFDPWTRYPQGTSVGQFGTLFDQIAAFVALVVGLGNPDQQTIEMVMLFYPAVLGTLIAVPVYFIGRRISGRSGGVIAVLILALSPGTILTRSFVGATDHQIAESLFMAIAMVGVMVALRAARDEKPVFELFTAREWDALRAPLGWGAFAGFTIGLYMWAWPPAIMMVGLLAIYLFVELCVEYVRGEAPEHTAIVMATAMSVAALMALVKFETLSLTVTKFSLIQPLLAVLTGAGVLVMAVAAREWDSRGFDQRLYPVAFLVAAGVITGIVAVVLPDVFDYVYSQVMRIFGYTATAESRTVAEARPLSMNPRDGQYYWVSFFQNSYGLLLYTGLIGGLVALSKVLLGDRSYPEYLFVAFWCFAMLLATFTQNRFDYYLILPVAALNGYLAWYVFSWAELDDLDELTDVGAYQVLAVATVLLIVVGSFATVVPANAGGGAGAGIVQAQTDGTQTGGAQTEQGNSFATVQLRTMTVAEENGPGEGQLWTPGLTWMRHNTPSPETEEFQHYGTFEQTDNYQYGDAQYGVVSWWDYGHYITHIGQRIPVANPFQQNAGDVADILLASNESAALERMEYGNGEEARYVVLDQLMADPNSQKYGAPASFDGIGVETADTRRLFYAQSQQQFFYIPKQRHYESLRVRLYQFHGSAIDPVANDGNVYVVDWQAQPQQTTDGTTVWLPQGNGVRQFNTTAEARQYVEQDGSSQIGGYAGTSSERVPALRHFRLVHASPNNAAGSTSGFIKTFEKVPGATIEGQGPPNANVSVRVPMFIRGHGARGLFYYRQRVQTGPDGSFTTTVPYSTTGYENFGPENGHTNVSVRSAGPYQLEATQDGTLYNASTEVAEAKVIGEDDQPVQVTLTEAPNQSGGNQSGDGNQSDGQDSSALADPSALEGTTASSTPTSDADGSVVSPTGLGALAGPPATSGALAGPSWPLPSLRVASTG